MNVLKTLAFIVYEIHTHTQPAHQSKYQLQQLAPVSARIWQAIEDKESEFLDMYAQPVYEKICKHNIKIHARIIEVLQAKYKSVFEFTRHQSAADDLPF